MSRVDHISPARLAEGSGATRGTKPKIGGLKKPDQRAANGTVEEAAKESFPASDSPSFTGSGNDPEKRDRDAADAANDIEKSG